MGSSSAAGARAPAEVSAIEVQPVKAVGPEEERPAEANLEEGEIPFNETIALEVLQALMDEEEEEVEEMPPPQRKRQRVESPGPAVEITGTRAGAESYPQQMPTGPGGFEGHKQVTPPAPERVSREEGPSGSTVLKKKKAPKDKRAPPTILMGEEGRGWQGPRGIRANDSLGDLETVREYVNHMFTPRDLSSIRERRYSVECLQEEGMQHLLEVWQMTLAFYILFRHD